MRVMLCGAVAASLLLGVVAPARSQGADAQQAHDPAKVALIHQLLTMTHGVDLAIAAIENGIAAQRTTNPRIPAVFWDRFLAEARNHRADFESMIVDVYERHFSADELRQLIAFNQTPVGQKMIAEMPAVMQESSQAGQQWGRKIGASIAAQLQSEGVQVGP
jgi:hypothetical protein